MEVKSLKKPYEAPEIEIIVFEVEDILTDSVVPSGENIEFGNNYEV